MQGFLTVDKPQAMTSHDVVQIVRRKLGIRKVGHAGTLDPMATGVLVVGIGRATRLIEYVVGRPKTYITTVKLGQTTNTYDAEGEITQTKRVMVTDEQIESALVHFRGHITQIPPMYSAIKKDGQPLYKLARKGIVVDRPPRHITIHQLILIDRDKDEIQLQINCSSGTYIRSLGHDIGQLLGCGGHLVSLRRTAISEFTEETAVSIDDISADKLLSPEIAITHLPRVDLTEAETGKIRLGQFIPQRPPHRELALATCYAANGTFLGILTQRDEQIWKPHKLFLSSE